MMKEMSHEKFTKMCRMLKLLLWILQLFLLSELVFWGIEFFSGSHDAESMLLLLAKAIYTFSMLIALRFGAAAFRSMERSETPFLYDVSDKIKAAAQWLLGGSILCSLYKGIVGLFGFDLFSSELSMTGSLTAGMILFALVYVIERGCRLQKESDETL